jgi:hypothetical protein
MNCLGSNQKQKRSDGSLLSVEVINEEKIPYLVLEYDMVPYLAPKDKIFSI